MNKIKRLINNPFLVFRLLSYKSMLNWLPDSVYLRIMYRAYLNKKLNLNDPQTFNEKLQWLKLHNKDYSYTHMADKYEAKRIVSKLIGEKYIIPTLGVWNTFEEINFNELPSQFVLKTTHDSGGVVICKDKNSLDINRAKEKLNASLKNNYFYTGREYQYKNIKPRIIAESFIEEFGTNDLVEYKIFCFDGEPKLLLICTGGGHGSDRTNDFYTIDFEHIPVTITNPNSNKIFSKPPQLEEMLSIARVLSKNTIQLRVDLYLAKNRILFGETTFFHDSGFCCFQPDEYDLEFGQYIHLPVKKGD